MLAAMARNGKIARLPLSVREELNERLRDNESGQTILEWLNSLEVTKKILADQFDGQPISDANLSVWRSGGFAEWLQDQEKVERVHKLNEMSLRMAQVMGPNLSKGLLAIAAGKLQEALEAGVEVEFAEEGGKAEIVGVTVDKLTKAAVAIRQMEIAEQSLTLDHDKHQLDVVKTELKGEEVKLAKKKFQRETTELFIKFSLDQKAKEIATSDMPNDAKMEALGQHLFGDAW